MTRLGIVTGMQSEAASLASWITGTPPPPPSIFCAGGNSGRAHSGALALIDDGATMIISMGIAGGLDPALRPGDIIVANAVIGPDGAIRHVDTQTTDRIAFSLEHNSLRVVQGTIATVERPAASPDAKRALRDRTGAMAVDMESSGCASAAAMRAVGFAAIRVIADPHDRGLPTSALNGLTLDGTPRPLAVLARVLAKPWEIPALYRAGRDSAVATNTLRRVAALDLRLFLMV